MGHNYQVIDKDGFKKHDELVTAFQNANFTRLDGVTPVDNADIKNWVKPTLILKPATKHKLPILIPAKIVPKTDSKSVIDNIGAQCRSERETFTFVQDPPPNDTAKLKKALEKEANFQSTHPYPIYTRMLYASFDDFFDGQNWTPTPASKAWVGTHFVYTLVIPVMKPPATPPAPPVATNELIFNFYPKTGAPTMNFLEDNAAYPLFGQV